MPTRHDNASPIGELALAAYLREAVDRRRHLAEGGALSAAQPSHSLSDSIGLAIQTATVNPHLPIAWPEWPPGVRLKVRAALQKVTRRLLAWYINPIIAQQNTHNFRVLRALQDAERANQQLAERLAALEREHRDATARLAELAEVGRGPTAATPQVGHHEIDRQSHRLAARDSAR